jgi:hypothetical protein
MSIMPIFNHSYLNAGNYLQVSLVLVGIISALNKRQKSLPSDNENSGNVHEDENVF